MSEPIYPPVRGQVGWYLCPNTPGVTVRVENAVSGRALKVCTNALGGLCAEMEAGHTYKVTATIAGKTVGHFIQVSAHGPGVPYNHFSSSANEEA
jgi:hypothetical protein